MPSPPLPNELPLWPALLARLPAASASFTDHGTEKRCEGVWLHDLATNQGLPSRSTPTRMELRTVIMAKGADGYRAAFTLAEIDPALGNHKVLVANRCNGQPLPAGEGPLRLVVPGETRAARSVRQLASLAIIILP